MVQDRDGLVNINVHGALFRYVQYHMDIYQTVGLLNNVVFKIIGDHVVIFAHTVVFTSLGTQCVTIACTCVHMGKNMII